MARRNADRRTEMTRGTTNIFADLGYPDAVERQAKLRLVYALNQLLEEQHLSRIARPSGLASASRRSGASPLQVGRVLG